MQKDSLNKSKTIKKKVVVNECCLTLAKNF